MVLCLFICGLLQNKLSLIFSHVFWLVLNLVQVNRSISHSTDPCVDRSEFIFFSIGFIPVFSDACITFQQPPDFCVYLKSEHSLVAHLVF